MTNDLRGQDSCALPEPAGMGPGLRSGGDLLVSGDVPMAGATDRGAVAIGMVGHDGPGGLISPYRIGIDPGCSGAIVILRPDLTVHSSVLMPTLKQGKSSRVNGAALAAFLAKCKGVSHAYLEAVHAMPKQGVTSVFTFGHAAGVAEGILQGLGIPYTLVPPQTWKKVAGLIGTEKDAARSRAIQLWPQWRELDKKGAGQALADAALIAWSAVRMEVREVVA